MAKTKRFTDAERLDWLEEQEGSGLISDDGGRWAVSSSGWQPIPERRATTMVTTFLVKKREWKTSVRKAIDAAMLSDDTRTPRPEV